MSSEQIIIDVGGGSGEYIFSEAMHNPNKKYILLEPETVSDQSSRKQAPSNVEVFQWKYSKESSIPLTSTSVDEVHVNFLMGELRDTGFESEFEAYVNLLRDIRRTMKPDSKLFLAEPGANALLAKRMLIKCGYHVLKTSNIDSDFSNTARMFNDIHELAPHDGNNNVQPILIEAALT